MPICAPVGGRPGVEMKGHKTGAWSEVIRHVETGALAAAQPGLRLRRPLRDAEWNSGGFLSPPHWCGSGGEPMPEVGEQPGDVTTSTGPGAPDLGSVPVPSV